MNGWRWFRVQDLGQWFGGGTPSKARPEFWTNGSVPWLSPKDMGPDILRTTQDKISSAAIEQSTTKLVAANSVAIVVRSGILERTLPVAIVPFETTLNQDMKALVPIDGIDARWVAWGLRAFERDLLNSCRKTGTTVASMEMPRLYDFRLPVPPLDEQHRIIERLEDLLSRLDSGVAGARNSLARAGNIKIAAMARMAGLAANEGASAGDVKRMRFGNSVLTIPSSWNASQVGQEATLVEYGTSTKAGTDPQNGDVPVLRMGNIQDGQLDWSSLKYIPSSHHELPRLLLDRGDLLFNRTNSAELVGKSAVFNADCVATFASYLIRVRFGASVDPRWANIIINSSWGRAYMSSVASQQVGQANVNGSKLKAMPMPVPPIGEQLRRIGKYVEHANAADRLAFGLERTIGRARLLKRAALKAAFSGRLTGRDGDIEAIEEMASV